MWFVDHGLLPAFYGCPLRRRIKRPLSLWRNANGKKVKYDRNRWSSHRGRSIGPEVSGALCGAQGNTLVGMVFGVAGQDRRENTRGVNR